MGERETSKNWRKQVAPLLRTPPSIIHISLSSLLSISLAWPCSAVRAGGREIITGREACLAGKLHSSQPQQIFLHEHQHSICVCVLNRLVQLYRPYVRPWSCCTSAHRPRPRELHRRSGGGSDATCRPGARGSSLQGTCSSPGGGGRQAGAAHPRVVRHVAPGERQVGTALQQHLRRHMSSIVLFVVSFFKKHHRDARFDILSWNSVECVKNSSN